MQHQPNTVNISNNNIGSINVIAASATVQYQFYGIYVPNAVTAAYTIADNLVGSTSTANSITVGTASTSITNFVGIASGTTGTVSLPGNTIQNCTVSGTGLSSFLGISVANSTGVLAITNNNIISCSNAGSGLFVPISNTSVVSNLKHIWQHYQKPYYIFQPGAFTGILNSGAVTSAITINNNQLGNASGGLITFSIANSSNLLGINNTAGATTTALVIQANNFQGITNSVQGTGNHTYIFNNAATLSQNISTNTFTSLTANITTGGGNVTFISNSVSLGATGTKIIKDNAIVTSFTKTGAGANLYFYYDTGSSVAGATITNEGNNFSYITINGSHHLPGLVQYRWQRNRAGKKYLSIILSTISQPIHPVYFQYKLPMEQEVYIAILLLTVCTKHCNSAYSYIRFFQYLFKHYQYTFFFRRLRVTGISIAGGTAQNVYYHTIHTLSSSALATTVSAVTVSGGTTVKVYKNKVYGLSNSAVLVSGGVYGINVTGGTTVSVYNNLVGNLTTTCS